MIIAILEDRKGFRTSLTLADFFSEIYIPIYHVPRSAHIYTTHDEEMASLSHMKKLTFRFHQFLDNKNKVAFYKEWNID